MKYTRICDMQCEKCGSLDSAREYIPKGKLLDTPECPETMEFAECDHVQHHCRICGWEWQSPDEEENFRLWKENAIEEENRSHEAYLAILDKMAKQYASSSMRFEVHSSRLKAESGHLGRLAEIKDAWRSTP